MTPFDYYIIGAVLGSLFGFGVGWAAALYFLVNAEIPKERP